MLKHILRPGPYQATRRHASRLSGRFGEKFGIVVPQHGAIVSGPIGGPPLFGSKKMLGLGNSHEAGYLLAAAFVVYTRSASLAFVRERSAGAAAWSLSNEFV